MDTIVTVRVRAVLVLAGVLAGFVLLYGGYVVLAFHNGHPLQAFVPLVALGLSVPGHHLVRRVVRWVRRRRPRSPALLPPPEPEPVPAPGSAPPLVRSAVPRPEDV